MGRFGGADLRVGDVRAKGLRICFSKFPEDMMTWVPAQTNLQVSLSVLIMTRQGSLKRRPWASCLTSQLQSCHSFSLGLFSPSPWTIVTYVLHSAILFHHLPALPPSSSFWLLSLDILFCLCQKKWEILVPLTSPLFQWERTWPQAFKGCLCFTPVSRATHRVLTQETPDPLLLPCGQNLVRVLSPGHKRDKTPSGSGLYWLTSFV